jgi:flagellar hook assembly protein FlgD
LIPQIGYNRPCAHPATTVYYDLPETGHATIRVYGVSGRPERTLVNETKPRGRHVVRWDGRDDGGVPLASGVYFARLEFQGGSYARKIVLLK